MSKNKTIYQVVTGVTFQGLYPNDLWKLFSTKNAAKQYAEVLNNTKSMEYDYVGIVQMELN